MSLGNKIYELRTSKNMSQIEFADQIDVSRQAVSKWETDAAIPDLDKLIKICDIFNITLDELTGRDSSHVAQAPQTIVVEKSSSITVSKILGCVLISVSLIGFFLLCLLAHEAEDLYIPIPVLISVFICGILCLCLKTNIGYWCAWVACAPIIILTPHVIGLPVLFVMHGTHVVLLFIISVIGTKQLLPLSKAVTKKSLVFIIIGWGISVLLYITLLFLPLEWSTKCLINYVFYIFFAALLTYTIRYQKTSKNPPRAGKFFSIN